MTPQQCLAALLSVILALLGTYVLVVTLTFGG